MPWLIVSPNSDCRDAFQKFQIRPICLAAWPSQLLALQTQIFFAIVENLFHFFC
jgi:hypothetical protein